MKDEIEKQVVEML
jgi:hypothetical protein